MAQIPAQSQTSCCKCLASCTAQMASKDLTNKLACRAKWQHRTKHGSPKFLALAPAQLAQKWNWLLVNGALRPSNLGILNRTEVTRTSLMNTNTIPKVWVPGYSKIFIQKLSTQIWIVYPWDFYLKSRSLIKFFLIPFDFWNVSVLLWCLYSLIHFYILAFCL